MAKLAFVGLTVLRALTYIQNLVTTAIIRKQHGAINSKKTLSH